jgi:hypothetical protein
VLEEKMKTEKRNPKGYIVSEDRKEQREQRRERDEDKWSCSNHKKRMGKDVRGRRRKEKKR